MLWRRGRGGKEVGNRMKKNIFSNYLGLVMYQASIPETQAPLIINSFHESRYPQVTKVTRV